MNTYVQRVILGPFISLGAPIEIICLSLQAYVCNTSTTMNVSQHYFTIWNFTKKNSRGISIFIYIGHIHTHVSDRTDLCIYIADSVQFPASQQPDYNWCELSIALDCFTFSRMRGTTRNTCYTRIRRYRVILSVLDPRKCKYLKDYSLEFEHAYMTTYLASWEACRYFCFNSWTTVTR